MGNWIQCYIYPAHCDIERTKEQWLNHVHFILFEFHVRLYIWWKFQSPLYHNQSISWFTNIYKDDFFYDFRMVFQVSSLLKCAQATKLSSRNLNCWIASITKPHRKAYQPVYPTLLQFPDGSTIYIRYHEPVGIIKLPLDLSTLTEEQRRERLTRRIPKTKVKAVEEIEDIDFDENRYLKLQKKPWTFCANFLLYILVTFWYQLNTTSLLYEMILQVLQLFINTIFSKLSDSSDLLMW